MHEIQKPTFDVIDFLNDIGDLSEESQNKINDLISRVKARKQTSNNVCVHVERCGCGKKAHALVYDHKEPHCKSCVADALDCKFEIPVEVL